jgi:hypothetical protein
MVSQDIGLNSPAKSLDKDLRTEYDVLSRGRSDENEDSASIGSASEIGVQDNSDGGSAIENRRLLPAISTSILANVAPNAGSSLPQISEEEQNAQHHAKNKPVTWSSLPNKDQLILLVLARLSEPLTQTSLQTYMFYQLQSFDPSLPESVISYQIGLLSGAFTGAQFATAFLWGRIADDERIGRKKVLMIGLAGTAISAVGFGFSKSFASVMAFRILGGVLNGNIGVLRTVCIDDDFGIVR